MLGNCPSDITNHSNSHRMLSFCCARLLILKSKIILIAQSKFRNNGRANNEMAISLLEKDGFSRHVESFCSAECTSRMFWWCVRWYCSYWAVWRSFSTPVITHWQPICPWGQQPIQCRWWSASERRRGLDTAQHFPSYCAYARKNATVRAGCTNTAEK